MKLSDYVFQFVADLGVKHVFLVTGGGAMHLNASLAQEKRITPVCNSHEQASAMGAESYAKTVNGLGVALVTTGPGSTNAVTGVAGAWLDSTPTMFLSGQVKRPDRMFDAVTGEPLGMRQLGVQEIDIVSIVRPITKYAVTVLDPLSIRYELEKAYWLAMNGRPGPVWIDIPLDVQATPIPEPETLLGFDASEYAAQGANENLKDEVARVVEKLRQAERPLLFVGNGTRLARAEQQFTELRLLLDIPTVATWCAADLVPSDVPTFVGRPGNVAARGANFALQNCDLLLVLGARLDMAITGYAPQNVAREAHKVAVDIDPAELKKLAPHLQQPVVADCGAFLDELLAQLKLVTLDHARWAAWNKRAAVWKTRYDVVTDEHRQPSGLVSIYNLAEVIGTESKQTDKLVSGSSGSGIEIFLLACPTRVGQRIFHTAGLGSMGYGLPMSIAVSIGAGQMPKGSPQAGAEQTILVDGDGGFQFNIQELETVRRLGLPIKMFVLNNDGYASIRASQKAYFGSALIGADAATGITVPDLSKVAESYGIAAYVIHDQTRLREQVREVLAMPGPVVVDVRVIPDEVRAPRLQSYQRADGSFVSKPLEDLFPFLSREEFMENMIVKPMAESLE
ncbi:thiamine pyrophosphate-binding protein [Granulicella sp. 5B5]|uniref:thiamine pyrophosphate-binding protein n=1 Tax=Granulicella sp. 5B5 TaxID=1617967 RepID=UPI0015F6348B|nr:thiamine pyrophosphate-binding protein [Granulicella sp. 5B5]QMV18751.1 thiamine pyrophosphate-binding protein [Granulicella sp. 5B5]